jgi:hypothetical protein
MADFHENEAEEDESKRVASSDKPSNRRLRHARAHRSRRMSSITRPNPSYPKFTSYGRNRLEQNSPRRAKSRFPFVLDSLTTCTWTFWMSVGSLEKSWSYPKSQMHSQWTGTNFDRNLQRHPGRRCLVPRSCRTQSRQNASRLKHLTTRPKPSHQNDRQQGRNAWLT